MYDFFLKADAYNNIPIDVVWHFKMYALISVPFIATQEDGYSDVVKAAKSKRGFNSWNK